MAAPSTKQQETSQLVGVLIVLVILIAMAIFGVLVAVGVVRIIPPDAEPVGSMAAAESLCDQRIRQDYGDTLSSVSVDGHSSRYDQMTGHYKMFYKMDVFRGNNQQSGVQDFYINCFVSAERGIVERIEYLDNKKALPKTIRRRSGNEIGF